jgi:N-methylhydantoinase A
MSTSQGKPVVRASFDIGGTFTDIVILQADGSLGVDKVLSVPELVAAKVAKRIERALSESGASHLSGLTHGTTVGSNALLEAKGAVAGLLTTRGFRDALEMRRFSVAGAQNIDWQRSPPLVRRALRKEVTERVLANGSVLKPLDEDETRRALLEFKDLGLESLAICFVNAYLNPEHEQRARELAAELLPGVQICASHEVLPTYREYERTSTTCVNAYLMPVVSKYIDSLDRELARFGADMRIMQSNGGVMSSQQARQRPIYTVESGPAAGALAATRLAREMDSARAVSFDMGGTTVKACLIDQGDPVEKSEFEVGGEANVGARWFRGKGYIIAAPTLDIVEAGAGGGSIAYVDERNTLRVGPRSAGAVPGPVCYGGGGTQPTITDANVVLGYLNPQAIAGGTVAIDRQAALKAISEALCKKLDLPPLEVAYGVCEVANATMMRTIRAVTTERGCDPRSCTLIAFGGAGPLHAAALAEKLDMVQVCIPLYPGLFSALGLHLADLRYDYVQSLPGPLAELNGERLEQIFGGFLLRAEAEAAADGVAPNKVRFERYVDLRYERQTSDTRIRVPDGVPAEHLPQALAGLFHEEHQRIYNYCCRDEAVSIVNVRMRSYAPGTGPGFSEIGDQFRKAARASSAVASREAYFGPRYGLVQTRIIRRSDLMGKLEVGPLIVEEFDTTVVVPPGWGARLDNFGSILLEADGLTPERT